MQKTLAASPPKEAREYERYSAYMKDRGPHISRISVGPAPLAHESSIIAGSSRTHRTLAAKRVKGLRAWKALGEVWPTTRVQRCWVHKTAACTPRPTAAAADWRIVSSSVVFLTGTIWNVDNPLALAEGEKRKIRSVRQ